ncbi:conserved hypothetical protein [Perkinsus marinus ATCC 50983]|uniref:Tc1-like transposase DDE domain-containing protein n=1 Tax=Perkinsus marinus (strain ATCC 50983 / TXsc) TaxID=423536 RepID=C5L2S6_PERM5|nr:conserved hypothetical protein [Perkinsus marinus ATCC 50983]EER08991.1 conserved hypothetical protein [Perkinsus marinus ATCC 50983]|eukprot:XP_002777175.1 conserved hypothetical protein [Perkinsus marinus ATCC 50983]
MAYLVGRDADLTLKQIADEVSREWNVELSTSTVARALEGRLISMKQLQLIPEARNSEVNKVKRRDFAQWLQVNAGRYRLVWIDETGYNLYTCRSKGRSAKGQRARKTCANQRGKHVTLICAVCNEGGILAWQSMLGGCKKEDFEAFLRDVLDKLANQPDGRPFCLLYDNAPCHATADNTCDALNVAYKRVSPYSCALNPIENCFSPLKSALKRMISEHGQVQPHDGESLQEARSRVLLSFCPQAVDAVTVATVSNSLVHVLTSEVPRALNGEDM